MKRIELADNLSNLTQWTPRVLLLTGATVTLVFSQLDPLGVLHADDLTHYLYAKWAWTWPSYLLNDWGRPGFTIAYFLPAGVSWGACRVLSTLITAASAYFAYRIALHLGICRAWIVIPLCYLQPMLFKLAQTTLTETPLAFYLTVAVYLAQRGRWSSSAAWLSACFITRHEAIVFLPVWIYCAWREHVPLVKLWPLFWAPICVNAFAPLAGVEPAVMMLFEPRPTLQYGQGGWLTFLSRSLEAFGPGISVLAMTGFAVLHRRHSGGLLTVSILVYFACQTIIRALGLYASGGYARFLVPIGPMLAVAAVVGWNQLLSHDKQRQTRAVLLSAGAMTVLWLAMERQLVLYSQEGDAIAELPEIHDAVAAVRISSIVLGFIAMMTALLNRMRITSPYMIFIVRRAMSTAIAGLILLAAYHLCRPLHAPPQAILTQQTIDMLRAYGFADRELFSASVWVDYLAGHKLSPDRPPVRELLRGAPIGSLMLWERQFAGNDDHRIPLEMLQLGSSFSLIYESPSEPYQHTPYLRVFEKVSPWNDTDPSGPIEPNRNG